MGIQVDVTEAMALGGFLTEMSATINTPQYMGPVLKYVHSRMSEAFTAYMAALAPVEYTKFHHVYEWGEIGQPRAQLWRDVLVGRGASRIATFEWLESKTIVPVVHPDAVGRAEEVHVFSWKAPVMEYNTDITIRPKRGQYLAFFTGPPGAYTPEELKIIKGGSVTVQFPGGEATHGAFTREYVDWWAGGGAETVFNTEIRVLLEENLANMPLQSVTGEFRAGKRATNKTFTIASIGRNEVAFRAGQLAARRYLQALSRNYIAEAQARSDAGGGLQE